MKALIIIPALNPDGNLINYIDRLIENGFGKIIVVNDGSDEKCADIFAGIEARKECHLLVHRVNRGKGRALKDAMRCYINSGLPQYYDGVITVDADGQHTVEDVTRVLQAMSEHTGSLVLGERAFDQNVPLRSKFGNRCTHILYKALYGIDIQDTQTGLRGIPNALIPAFCDLQGERYEYEMHMLTTCALKKIPVESVTIETVYLDGNASSHFNAVKDSIRIYRLSPVLSGCQKT